MVGSNRSISWLLGYNDVVKTIDDPGYVLADEIVEVPNGIHPATYVDGDNLTYPFALPISIQTIQAESLTSFLVALL